MPRSSVSPSHRFGAVTRRPEDARIVAVLTAMLLLVPMLTVASWARSQPAQAAIVDGVDWQNFDLGGTRVANAPGDIDLRVYFGYINSALQPAAAAVSDPNSVSYGQYLSLTAAIENYGASADQEQAVTDALAVVGATQEIGGSRTFTRSTMTVAEAERFFGVTFGVYAVPGVGNLAAPDAQPSLPGELSGVINAVFGLTKVLPQASATSLGGPIANPLQGADAPVAPSPATLATPVRTGVPEGCAEGLAPGGFAPNQLATAYGYEQLHDDGLEGQGQRLAVLELNANVSDSDLATFTDCFGFDGLTQLRQVNSGGDPTPGSGSIGEATLDVQVIAQVAPKLEAFELYSYNDAAVAELPSFLELLAMPLDSTVYGSTPPDVVSVSYGTCEFVYDGNTPLVVMGEQLLAMAAVAGMTYVVAAGDDGSSNCLRVSPELTLPSPAYPAISNWVTAVGGTGLTLTGFPFVPVDPPNEVAVNRQTGVRFESAWNDTLFAGAQFLQAGGGGGTSTILERPSWQTGPGVPEGSTRLNPDIAMYGDVFPGWTIYCTPEGCPSARPGWQTIGGTSAATPLAAGMLALMNQAVDRNAVSHPRPQLGFFNPYLYDIANRQYQPTTYLLNTALRDVTTGNNDIAGVGCCDATVGYDLASGWGSLYGEALGDVIFGTPTAPTITAAENGFDSALLTVDAPVSSGALPITGYQYTLDGGRTWIDAVVQGDPGADPAQVVAGNLPGAALLIIAVRAVNAEGPGLPSNEFALATTGSRFQALDEPIRALDTRVSGGPVVPGTPVTVDVSPPVGINPDDVVAVAYNLTVTGTQGSGYAVAYPSGDQTPESSTINWIGGNQTVANSFVGGADGLNVSVAVEGTPAQVIFDVMGYYLINDDQAALFVPVEPQRAYDSRIDGSPLSGGESVTVPLTGVVPEGATAVAYTLTETGTVGSGYLSVGLPGEPQPPTSVLNWSGSSLTVANSSSAAVSAGADPSIEVFAGGTGSTEFIVDVIGYFAPASVAPSGLQFAPIDPERAYDSRVEGGALSGGQSRTTSILVSEMPQPPSEVQAVAVNLTVTGTVSSGYLTLARGGTGQAPVASTINWMGPNATLANGTVVGVGRDTVTTFAGGGGSTQYLTDVAGYYTLVP